MPYITMTMQRRYMCVCWHCSDPPLDEDDVPTGQWLCHKCLFRPSANNHDVSFFSVYRSIIIVFYRQQGVLASKDWQETWRTSFLMNFSHFHHQKLIRSRLSHIPLLQKKLSKFVRTFLRCPANRQNFKHRVKRTLLGGDNDIWPVLLCVCSIMFCMHARMCVFSLRTRTLHQTAVREVVRANKQNTEHHRRPPAAPVCRPLARQRR